MERLKVSARGLVCVLAAVAVLSACSGKKSTTVTTSAGNVTVEQGSNGNTTVKSEQGEMKFGKGAVDPASLGLPVYPGAKPSDTNSVSMSNMAKGEGGQLVMLTTDDPFDKVYDFYKGQMPNGSQKMKMASGGMQMATFQVGERGAKDSKTVMIQESNGKVTIQLVHATKQ
jgi:hypothetical protein